MTLKWILLLPLVYLFIVVIWQNEEIKRFYKSFNILALQSNLWSTHPRQNSTIENVFDLPRDVCQRMDWKEHLSVCKNYTKWERRNLNKTLRTNISNSYLELFIQNGSTPSRIQITTFDGNGIRKTQGGDYWRANVIGAHNFKMNIKMFDHNSGEYSGVFAIPFPGYYSISVNLEYSMCEGLTNPPKYWFIKGEYYFLQIICVALAGPVFAERGRL